MSTIGHPLSDFIGLIMPFLTAQDGPNPHKGFIPGATPGLPTQEQAIAWYTEVAGWNPEPDLVWGAAFGMYRSSVIMQGIAARYAVRQASSEKAKDYADMMVPFGQQAYKIFLKAKEAGPAKAKL
jgi:aminoglycoside phosphotransferase (APT) family kinase protein